MLDRTGSMLNMFQLLERFWNHHCGHMNIDEGWFNEDTHGRDRQGLLTDLADVQEKSEEMLRPAIGRLRQRLYRIGLHCDDPTLPHRPDFSSLNVCFDHPDDNEVQWKPKKQWTGPNEFDYDVIPEDQDINVGITVGPGAKEEIDEGGEDEGCLQRGYWEKNYA